jgi:RNA polymerase sigma-70 factor (ECF subfamily)
MHGTIPFGGLMRLEMVAAIPQLRAFAVSLCGNPDRADDLVQETLSEALAKISSFARGTSLVAWLLTILRQAYYSELRKRRQETTDADGRLSRALVSNANQDDRLGYLDFRGALQKLPAHQREALILIDASRLSYEEAAGICQCAVGTIKARASRARRRLSELLVTLPQGG